MRRGGGGQRGQEMEGACRTSRRFTEGESRKMLDYH